MIFNTNKNTQCNKKSESLSYYTYTSERKYSDSTKTLHDNFCKNIKNTSALLEPIITLDNTNNNRKTSKKSSNKNNFYRSKKQSPRMNRKGISKNNFKEKMVN